MAFLTINTRLARDPETKQTRNGHNMVTGFAYGKLGEGEKDLALSLMAFGEVANELQAYQKGDSVNLCGSLKMNTYTNRDGVEVDQLSLMVDGIAGKNKTKQIKNPQRQANGNKQTQYAQNHQPQTQANEFNQSMAFQQRPNQAAPVMQAPTQPNQFNDDDINF